jgi:hypothetical protein
MATATKTAPRKGVERKTSSRVKKGVKAGADKTQQIMPEVDESNPAIEKELKAYCELVTEHGELTRELTASKQNLMHLLKDNKLKRYWSKKLSDGVELKPEGEKLERIKNPDAVKGKKKKQPAATE